MTRYDPETLHALPTAQRLAVLAWLRDHGFDPNNCYVVEEDDGLAVATVYTPGENGARQVSLDGMSILKHDVPFTALRPLP